VRYNENKIILDHLTMGRCSIHCSDRHASSCQDLMTAKAGVQSIVFYYISTYSLLF
jgi:hypothetical protein